MALTFYWRCEGTTLTADDYSAGDTTATASGAPAINATAALVGSNGIQIDAAAEGYDFDTASIIGTGEGSIGFKMRIQTWADAAGFFYVRGASYTDSMLVGMTSTDELFFRINEDTDPISISTTAANLSTGTTYFVTASWLDGTGFRLRVYNDGTGTLIEEVTGGDFVAPADFDNPFRWGEATGVGTPAYYLDNVFIGSAYGDADAFLTNRNITSYSQYGVGGGPTVTWVGYIG